jgi:GTP-binding protein HflX
LFNKLTKKKQSSRSRLFETLDTKISRVYLGANKYIGLIDTVGFINNIPTSLIESFKATLEEVNKADILINIVDVNDLNANQKIRVTKSILIDTGVEKNKISEMITVYNKIDIKGSKSLYQHKKNYISALTGEGVSDLKRTLKNSLI